MGGLDQSPEFKKVCEDIPFLRLVATSHGRGCPYSALRLAPLLLLFRPARVVGGGGIRSEFRILKSVRNDIPFLRPARVVGVGGIRSEIGVKKA